MSCALVSAMSAANSVAHTSEASMARTCRASFQAGLGDKSCQHRMVADMEIVPEAGIEKVRRHVKKTTGNG